MEGQAVLFLFNTGLSVAILTEELYRHRFTGTLPLKPTSMQLFDYSHSKIRVQGCFAASVTFQGRNACILLYIASEGTTVLGLDAIVTLQIRIEKTSL